jgi:tripartite ATP-independent transporter DctM subunit
MAVIWFGSPTANDKFCYKGGEKMTPLEIGLIGLAACFVLIFLQVPIAFAFGIAGLVGIWILKDFPAAISSLGTIPYNSATNYSWTTIPMFVMMGFFAQYSRLAEEFYYGVRAWIGKYRGGLAGAVIIGNTGFGACSGDSISAAITFTSISLPEMRRYGYHDMLTLGSIAGGSMLAQLIPPSFAFIVFGAISLTSISKLFIAGILPGVICAVLYLATIYIICRRNPSWGPAGPSTTWKEKLTIAPGMWAILVVFLVIIGGIYAGFFTATEAGACGAFVVLILALARRKLSRGNFFRALVQTGLVTGMVGFLLIGCLEFNLFLVLTKVQFTIASFISGLTTSPTLIIIIIVLLFIILGMVMDSLALVLLLVPIVFPLTQQVGIDPVHFGVCLVVATNIGSLSPPFGIIVFALGTVVKDVPIFKIFKSTYPFIGAILILQVLVIFIPQISLWLPDLMIGN